MEYLLFIRGEKIRQGASRTIALKQFIATAASTISALWNHIDIPIQHSGSIHRKFEELIQSYRNIVKTPSNYEEEEWDQLFMISRCRCGIENGLPCTCAGDNKIPENQNGFSLISARKETIHWTDMISLKAMPEMYRWKTFWLQVLRGWQVRLLQVFRGLEVLLIRPNQVHRPTIFRARPR